MKRRLRWKLEPKETGLRTIGAGPRGSVYHDGEKEYAWVSALGGGWHGPVRGWYWGAGWDSDVPHYSSIGEPCPTAEEAKRQAEEYVAKHLAASAPKPKG